MKIPQILFLMFAGVPVIVSAQKTKETKEVKKTVEVEVAKKITIQKPLSGRMKTVK